MHQFQERQFSELKEKKSRVDEQGVKKALAAVNRRGMLLHGCGPTSYTQALEEN